MLKDWGDKYFALGRGQADHGQLCVTYGWCRVFTSVYGYETIQKHPNGKRRKTAEEQMLASMGKPTGRFMYPKPYETSYETPCLRFRYTDTAKLFFENEMSLLYEHLKEKTEGKPDLTVCLALH